MVHQIVALYFEEAFYCFQRKLQVFVNMSGSSDRSKRDRDRSDSSLDDRRKKQRHESSDQDQRSAAEVAAARALEITRSLQQKVIFIFTFKVHVFIVWS